ncbi:hypothetical protein [Streptomyces sp. SAS_275]|uniref:hypothetical protein n=1 Tax=Streptomyces sp. SAS_275 TaxID=3412746 RepID=UPI00403CFCD7
MSEPITNLEDAVRELGALPMPVGPTPQPMSAERLQEIAECQPGEWYSGEWRSQFMEAGEYSKYSVYLVVHAESGTLLAEFPDWAGPLALFMADAHDAVPELLTENARLRARVSELEAERHSTNEALDDAVQALRERPDGITRLIAPTQALRVDADRIVAHRPPGVTVVYCTICCRGNDQLDALTSADLPDGGVCVSCDRDVLLMAEQGGA